MEQRVKANGELMKQRKQIVEHPFGTIKFWNDQRHFLMRGLEKVKAEFSLSALGYNIKRAINLWAYRHWLLRRAEQRPPALANTKERFSPAKRPKMVSSTRCLL